MARDNKGYFTVKEWNTKLMFLAVQYRYHCDEDQAMQMLSALIKEGKIEEYKPGKYRPISALT